MQIAEAPVRDVRPLFADERAELLALLASLGDADWASVRDPTALEKLPPEEREAWRKLWADVRDLRDRSAPQADPQDKSK